MSSSPCNAQWALLMGLAIAEPACADSGPSPARSILAGTWDTVWARRQELEDTTLVGPIALVAQERVLFVLDRGANRIVAFDRATGELVWSVGTRGGGPGEFKELMSVSEVGRDVAIIDIGNRRVSILSAEGSIIGSEPLPDEVLVYAECDLGSNLRLAAAFDGLTPLLLIRNADLVVNRFQAPWTELQGADPLLTQVDLARSSAGCVVGGLRGGGLARFDSAGVQATARYVELVPLPEVVRVGTRVHVPSATLAARDIAVFGDTVVVLFGGTGASRGRLLDFYELRRLQYVTTRVLPFAGASMTMTSDGLTYVLRIREGVFDLIALRFRASQ